MMEEIDERQLALLRTIRMEGAITALLFSKYRSEGGALREAGLIDGIGDGTHITDAGFAMLAARGGK